MKVRIIHTIYEEREISEKEQNENLQEWDSKMDLINLLNGSNFIYLDTESEKID